MEQEYDERAVTDVREPSAIARGDERSGVDVGQKDALRLGPAAMMMPPSRGTFRPETKKVPAA